MKSCNSGDYVPEIVLVEVNYHPYISPQELKHSSRVSKPWCHVVTETAPRHLIKMKPEIALLALIATAYETALRERRDFHTLQ